MRGRDPRQELELLVRDLKRRLPGMVVVAVCGDEGERAAILTTALDGVVESVEVLREVSPGAALQAPASALVHLSPPRDEASAEAWWMAANRLRDPLTARPGQVVIWTDAEQYARAAGWAPDLFSVLGGTAWLDGAALKRVYPVAPPEVVQAARARWAMENQLVTFPFEPGSPKRRLSDVWIPRRVRVGEEELDAVEFLLSHPHGRWMATRGAGASTVLQVMCARMLDVGAVPVVVDFNALFRPDQVPTELLTMEDWSRVGVEAKPWSWVVLDALSDYAARNVPINDASVIADSSAPRDWVWYRLEGDRLVDPDEWKHKWREETNEEKNDAIGRRYFQPASKVLPFSTVAHVSEGWSDTTTEPIRSWDWWTGWSNCLRDLPLIPFTVDEARTLLAHRLGTTERASACLAALPPQERERNPNQFFPVYLLAVASLWERDGVVPRELGERHRAICRLHLSQHVAHSEIALAEEIMMGLARTRAIYGGSHGWLDDHGGYYNVSLEEAVAIVQLALTPHGQRDAAASWLAQLSGPEGPVIIEKAGVRLRYPYFARALAED